MQVLDATFVASAQDARQLPAPAFAEVAFAGRSNVGKSSLINTLVQRRKLVRTSSTPGCTRGLALFRVRLPDAVLDLVDLPGYGYAQRSKSERRSWGPMVERFFRERAGLRAVVVIVDARRGMESEERELLEFLAQVPITPIVVATKMDKIPPSKRRARLKTLSKEAGVRMVGFSATTRDGRDELWNVLLRTAAIGETGTGESAIDEGDPVGEETPGQESL